MMQPGIMFNTLASVPLDSMSVQTAPPPDPTSDHLQRCMDSVQELAKTIACAIDKWHGSGLLDGYDIHGTYAKVSAHLEQLPADVECMRCTRRTYKSALHNNTPSRVSLSGTCTCDADSEPAKRRRTSGTPPHKLAITDQTGPSEGVIVIDTVVSSARSSCDPRSPPREGCQIQEDGLPPFSADHDLDQPTALPDSQFPAHPKLDTWQGDQEAHATLKPDEVLAGLEKKQIIKFKDAVGRKFTFPWHLCKTWTGMESLIKQAFVHVDVIGARVHEGHYDLMGPAGEIVLPQIWDAIIEPGWEVSMHMWTVPETPKKKKKKKEKKEKEKKVENPNDEWMEAYMALQMSQTPFNTLEECEHWMATGERVVDAMSAFNTREEWERWCATEERTMRDGQQREKRDGAVDALMARQFAQMGAGQVVAAEPLKKAKKAKDRKKAKRISVSPTPALVAGPSTALAPLPEMPLFNTREEYEHWVTTGEPPATFVDPAVVVADAPKRKQKMKKIPAIAAWMGGAPAKPVKTRNGEIEQLQQPVNISRPQAQEPGGQSPTLTHTSTASAEPMRTQSRASSETSGCSVLQPRPEYVDMDRTVNEAEAYQATERGNTRPATVTAEAVKRPSTGSHVFGSSRKSTSPSVRTGGRVRVMPEGATFYISHKTALQGRQKTQSPDHVTSKVEPDELGCHDEGRSDLGEDEVLPEQRMRSRSRRCSDISSREIEHGGDRDDTDEDMQSDSDDEQRFRARSLRRSHASGLGFDFDVDPGASSPNSEAVDAADDQTTEFGGHKGVSSVCSPHLSRPPTNISGGYNIDFDPPSPTASGNEDMLDPPPPVSTGSLPRLDVPSPPIQDQESRLRLRAKSDHQPPTSEPRGYNAQPGDSRPLTSATYLPDIPPLSDHNLDLQPGRSAVLAMLREGKIPCLEGFSSTDIESSAHVSTMYEWLCDEEYESSSNSLAENQRRSPSPPPTGRENRAVLAPKTTTSDVGSDDDVSEDVSAVQALLNRWLDSSASALLLEDDAPVT
jgi:hypothetical protein